MRRAFLAVLLVWAFGLDTVNTQSTGAGDILAIVDITARVTAGGYPLPAGTYEIRLTTERPTPLPGASAHAQQRVEFLRDGKVVAREIAEVLDDDDLPSIGLSSHRVTSGTRVELLQGGEFLRISVKRGRERYLLHLTVTR
jgi:hypothetical protein